MFFEITVIRCTTTHVSFKKHYYQRIVTLRGENKKKLGEEQTAPCIELGSPEGKAAKRLGYLYFLEDF